MPKRKTKRKTTKRTTRKRATKRVAKKKLAGFTRTKGKYKLVFKKGKTLSVGKSSYSSKKTLVAAARKFLKK